MLQNMGWLAVSRERRGVRAEGFRALWCGIMHDAPKWPIHGHYECGICGHRYPVPWEEAEVPASRRPVLAPVRQSL